jgi:hypothetical protein
VTVKSANIFPIQWSSSSALINIPIAVSGGDWPIVYNYAQFFEFWRCVALEYSIVSPMAATTTATIIAHLYMPYQEGVSAVSNYGQIIEIQQCRQYSTGATIPQRSFVQKSLLRGMPTKWYSTSNSATSIPNIQGNINFAPSASANVTIHVNVKGVWQFKAPTTSHLSNRLIGYYNGKRVENEEGCREIGSTEEKSKGCDGSSVGDRVITLRLLANDSVDSFGSAVPNVKS